MITRTTLSRRKPLVRKVAMRRVRHDRIRARRAACFGPQAELCRRSHCPACGAWPCEPHHWPSRARGGQDRDCMPLCSACHRLFHDVGAVEFYRRTRVDAVDEVRHFQFLVAHGGPVHSGRCIDAKICNACQSAAESAWERRVSRV